MDKGRCDWVTDDPLYQMYHDEEWGNFENFHHDHYLFEMLTLEGAQAGLSWITILKRRENYRKAFDFFDPSIVATYNSDKVTQLLQNEGIIRNKRKIESTINNAKAIVQIQGDYGSFHAYLWEFIGNRRIINEWKKQEDVPASTKQSKALSVALKQRGFTFVGPIICYSFMQAIGLVNDHTKKCFLYGK